jgi:hypothetical protein
MLANIRLSILLALSALFVAAWRPAAAQVQGAPSESASRGHRATAKANAKPSAAGRASLASLGPNGYSNVLQPFLGNCCANSFLPRRRAPSRPRPPFAPGYRSGSDDGALLVVAVPVYIPYAIGYEPDEDVSAGDQRQAVDPDLAADSARGGQKPRWLASDDLYSDVPAGGTDDEAEAPGELEEPVVAQPATVLVFKDGHRADLVNYAILGDALFDFDGDLVRKIPLADLDLPATAKTNDARGVEFKLPLMSYVGSAPK